MAFEIFIVLILFGYLVFINIFKKYNFKYIDFDVLYEYNFIGENIFFV